MQAHLAKSVLISLAFVTPVTVAGVAWWSVQDTVDQGVPPESMRAELAGMIDARWSEEASKRYGITPQAWRAGMASTYGQADLANLEHAASAPDFRSMSQSLLGGGHAPVPASASKALGTPGSDLVFTPVTPCRIVDTRNAGGRLASGATRSFDAYTATDFTAQGGASGDCGIPENASAITVKLAASQPLLDGYLTAFPSDEPQPMASSLNYLRGVVSSNETHLKLCRPGCASEFSVFSLWDTDVVVDVTGYFIEPEATALDCVVASQSGNLDLLSGLQTRSVSCAAGYTATGGGCGGPLGIGISNSQPVVTAGSPTGWSCDLIGSLLSIVSYQVNATCCRIPGR